MGTSLSQAAPASHRIPAGRCITAEDRMERIGQLTAEQPTDAATLAGGLRPGRLRRGRRSRRPCLGDGTEDPAPYCAICDGDIGIFLKFGLDWRHYTGTDLSDIELIDPGHRPVIAWRMPGLPE